VAAAGISAGTTFAALLGTAAGRPELEDLSMGSPDQSSHVSAVVAWYGPMDYTTLDAQRQDLGQGVWKETADSGEVMMLGGTATEVPKNYRAFSPQTYINKDCPPFYFQHGTGDTIVPFLQSVHFAEALAKAIGKDKVTINLIKDANHFDRIHSSPENIKASLDFLDEHLR
jgi:acetyl esterase/lipase